MDVNTFDLTLIKKTLDQFDFEIFDDGKGSESGVCFLRNLKKKKSTKKFFHLLCIAYADHFEIEFSIGATTDCYVEVFRVKTECFVDGIVLLKTFLALSKSFLKTDPEKLDT